MLMKHDKLIHYIKYNAAVFFYFTLWYTVKRIFFAKKKRFTVNVARNFKFKDSGQCVRELLFGWKERIFCNVLIE